LALSADLVGRVAWQLEQMDVAVRLLFWKREALMICMRCGKETDVDSTFCRHCGAAVRNGLSHRLVRHSKNGRIAGVCAGIAEYLNADVTLVRVAWVILSVVPGGLIGGILAYLAAWILMPDVDAPPAALAPKRLTRSATDRKIAGVCGGLAEYLKVDPTAVRVLWAVLSIVPGAIVLGVLSYLVAWFIMPEAALPATTTVTTTAA
jgi:phage shock protein C